MEYGSSVGHESELNRAAQQMFMSSVENAAVDVTETICICECF